MNRFSFRQEIAAGFAAMVSSAIVVILAVGPGANTAATTLI